MFLIDKICHHCFGWFTKLPFYKTLKCSCGVSVVEDGLIKLSDYITASSRYPDRLDSEELTPDVKDAALGLLGRVNRLLDELMVKEVDVTSGFRPSSVNAGVGGATKSAHMTGEAIDLMDDEDQSLAKSITKELLEKYDLYREDYDYTKGKYTNWVHLQTRPTKSGRRIFRP